MESIAHKNYSFQTVELTGPTTFSRCNLVLAKIITNGFAFTTEQCNKNGLYIDGVKQDAFVWRRKGKWDKAEVIAQELDSAGKDAVAAWALMIQLIHAGVPAMTWTQFKDAYAAAIPAENCTYSTALFIRVVKAIAPGATWVQMRDFIRSHSFARLTGEDTEILEERS